ncbi:hypothetical protein EDD21DRAFT_124486 [Dissophora ornata]|nr:hypothetical protein BGZ58_005193 [Dissophora ornata]KAI8600807.1 hypothetical protein EDD21DRAFT_124486 [Dissophora ornata]
MTSSDMSESANPTSTSPSIVNTLNSLHKYPPSTMSPPHSVPWIPSESTTDPHIHQGSLKIPHLLPPSEIPSRRPWTNVEQEALYVAVQRQNLFGKWAEVGERMGLDHSPLEIEQEYMRLYGELPDSDDEDWSSQRNASTRSHMPGYATPPLTSTSSSTLSARSSQETFSQFHRSSHPAASEPSHRSPYRKYPAPHPSMDDYHDDENDESRMDIEQASPVLRLQSGKNSASRGRSDNALGEVKPPRTVRVWTLEQSEQLKNLIEDCFPGGYRINWVWVASQMGNTFTRKQCKNKWEIMRRRAGTEEEIRLLKKGHEEFGPSWSKIQEKYLPERSQGGISIMWSLLQTREAEQQQQQQPGKKQPLMGNTSPGPSATGAPPRSPVRPRKEMRAASAGACGSTPPRGTGGPVRKRSTDRDRPYRPRLPTHPIEGEHEGQHHMLSDRDMDRHHVDYYSHNDSTSREASLSPHWKRDGASAGSSPYSSIQFREGIPSKRFSVSSSESLSMTPLHIDHQPSPQYFQHRQQHAGEAGSEAWSERNRPMTWTEPLSRRLEYIIDQHYPNRQKVNWLKVSALMGSNPIVTKEQCKRRWYLMTQQDHFRTLKSEPLTALVKEAPNDMVMDMDPSISELGSRRSSRTESSPTSPTMSYSASGMPSPSSRKRPAEYMPWTEQEVELLKQGVERYGRSWVDIQEHYLKDRSVGSMASKWDYVLLKMRSTSKTVPGHPQSGGDHHPHSHPHLSGAEFSEGEMEDDEIVAVPFSHMSVGQGHH